MRTNGRGYGAFAALIGSSLVILVPAGGWFYVHGTLSLESLVLFLVLGSQFLMSMLRLMFARGNVDRIKAGNARIRDILTSLRDVSFEAPAGGDCAPPAHRTTCPPHRGAGARRVAESGTHGELVRRDGVDAALWREQERAKGWRLGQASATG